MKKTLTTPTGGKYTRKVKGKGKGKGKAATGGGVMHKAYSYTNKKGKTVHVPAHVEHPRRKAK